MITPIIRTFNNNAEVGKWWSCNPTAVRVKPEIKAITLDEYNQQNHNIKFPCEMMFCFY